MSLVTRIQMTLDLLNDLSESVDYHVRIIEQLKQKFRESVDELEKRGDTDLLLGLRLPNS